MVLSDGRFWTVTRRLFHPHTAWSTKNFKSLNACLGITLAQHWVSRGTYGRGAFRVRDFLFNLKNVSGGSPQIVTNTLDPDSKRRPLLFVPITRRTFPYPGFSPSPDIYLHRGRPQSPSCAYDPWWHLFLGHRWGRWYASSEYTNEIKH